MIVKMADISAVSIVLFIMFSGGHVSNHQDRQISGLDLPPTQDAIVENESVCSYIRIPEHEDVILVVTVGELKKPFIGVIKISADLQVLSRNEETAEVGQIIKSTEVEVTVVIRVVENHRSETCTNEEGKT